MASYEALRAQYFPEDGASTAPLVGMIDAASRGVYRFTYNGGTYEIFALGAQRGGGGNYTPFSSGAAFETTVAANATVSNRALGAEGENFAHALLLCRKVGGPAPGPCVDLVLKVRLTASGVTKNAPQGPRSLNTIVEPPTGETAQYQGGYWVTQWNTDQSMAATSGWTHRWPPQWHGVGSGALAERTMPAASHLPSTDHSVFWSTFVKESTDPAFYNSTAHRQPLLVLGDVQVWHTDGAQIGALREPLWSVEPGGAQTSPRALLCSLPAPSLADARAYMGGSFPFLTVTPQTWGALVNSSVPRWLRSCNAAEEVVVPWSAVTADPSSAHHLRIAGSTGNLAALGKALEKAVSDRLATWYPRELNLPFANGQPCWPDPTTEPPYPRMPCITAIPALGNLTLEPIRVEVYDNGSWLQPRLEAGVYGGPTRVTARTNMMSASGETIVLNITLGPADPEVLDAGFLIREPGPDFAGGLVVAVPNENAAGLLEGEDAIPARPAVVPLVTPPGEPRTTSPLLAAFATNTSTALETCVREAWSHLDAGVLTNLPGEPARLAVDDASTCRPIRNLVDLTLLLQLRSLVLEVRKGPLPAFDLVLPTADPLEAVQRFASGDLDPGRVIVPLDSVAANGLPWDPDNLLFGLVGDRASPLAGRIVAVLPQNWTDGQLADAALALTWQLRHVVTSAAIEIDDLPLSPIADLVLDRLSRIQESTDVPQIAILVPSGVLPAAAAALPLQQHLYTISGLAAHPYVITIGAGTVEDGVHAWTRLGPAPNLGPKPDFLAPGVAGSAASAVVNALPLVELLHLAGIGGADLVRASLAGLAVPHQGTDPVHTFYMQGYGVLDPTILLEDYLGTDLPPLSASTLAQVAATNIGAHGVTYGFVPRNVDAVVEHLGNLTVPRWGAATFWNGTHAFALGGRIAYNNTWLSRAIVRIDPANGTIETLPQTLPKQGEQYATAWTGEHFFLFGGYVHTSTTSGTTTTTTTGASKEVVRYTPSTGEVRVMNAAFSANRSGGAAFHDGKDIYVFAGWGTREIWKYDVANDTLTQLSLQLPDGRSHMAVAWNGQHAFLFGGASAGGFTQKTIWRFDPRNLTIVDHGTLPKATSEATAIWDGDQIFVFGGQLNFNTCHRDVYRYDTRTGVIAPSRWQLPHAMKDVGVAWDGDRAILVGGGCAYDSRPEVYAVEMPYVAQDWTRFVSATSTPAGPLADALLATGAVEETRDVAGFLLAPGALDPYELRPEHPLRLDTPAIPLAYFTDWGVVGDKDRREASLKLLDADATLEAVVEALRSTLMDVGNVTHLSAEATRLLQNALNVPVEFAGPQEVSIATRHIALFDLLTTDLLDALQTTLTGVEAAKLGADPEAAKQAVLDATFGILPTLHVLTEDVQRHVEANATLTDDWPCGLGPIVAYAERMEGALLAKAAIINGMTRTGLTPAGAAPDAFALRPVEAAGKTNAVQQLAGYVCKTTDPVWLIEYLEHLRAISADLMAVERALLETGQWATRYGRAPAASEGWSLIENTTEVHGLATLDSTAAAVIEQNARIQALLNATIDQVIDLIRRIAPTRNIETIQPRVPLPTLPNATSVAPLGPYVGLTWITSRNVSVVSPLTGNLLLKHDVTVPVPSLLWNNPELQVTVSYRDGVAAASGGLTLHDSSPDVFRSIMLHAEVVIDGIAIPFAPRLGADAGLPVAAPPELALVSKAADALLNTSTGNATTAAAKLVKSVVANLTLDVEVPDGLDVLDGLLVSLYSRPTTQGNSTNDTGVARVTELFPHESVVAYHPYASSVRHALEGIPTYAGASYDGIEPLNDPDHAINARIRDAYVGPDGAESPDDPPHWAHRSRARLDVEPGTRVEYGASTFDIHLQPMGEHHRFELDLYAGLDPVTLVCDLLSSRNALYATLHKAPFSCAGLGARVELDASGIVALLCGKLAAEAQPLCATALPAALMGDGLARQERCEVDLPDNATCEALLIAADLLSPLERLSAADDVAPVPFVRSLARDLLQRRDQLGLDRASLVAGAVANNPDKAIAAIEAAVDKLIATLPSLVDVEVTEPPRVERDDLTIAGALLGHGLDQVAGVDWAGISIPPSVFDIYDEVREAIHAGATRSHDAQVYDYAASVRTQLDELGNLTVEAALDAWELGGARWVTSTASATINTSGQAMPRVVTIGSDEIVAKANESGVVVTGLPPLGARFVAVHGDDNVQWSAEVRAAEIVAEAAAAGTPAIALARQIQSALVTPRSWQIDRGLHEIRATSEDMIPKLGAFAYSTPVAPHASIRIRTDGEFYFENADGILILTSDGSLKDLLFDTLPALQDVVAATEDPDSRAEVLLRAIDQTRAAAFSVLNDQCLAVRHLNPLARFEHWTKQNSDGSREDRAIARLGGLRVRSAADSFEMTSCPGEELHAIVLFFPLVDASTIEATRAWIQAGAEEGAANALEQMRSKVVVSRFALQWDTFIGVPARVDRAAALAHASIALSNPWRSNVEDVELYWAMPSGTPLERIDFSAEGASGASLGAFGRPIVVQDPADPGSTWMLQCGEQYGGGRWYTPSLAEPRGVATWATGELWSEGAACARNINIGLIPDKWPGGSSFPLAYAMGGKSLLSALQTDLNLVFEREGGTPQERVLFDNPSSILRVLAPMSCWSFLYAVMDPLGLADWGGVCATPFSTTALGAVLDPVIATTLGAFRDAYGLADPTVDLAMELLNAYVGVGAITDILPEASYVERPTLATGSPNPLHVWLTLDRATLEALAGDKPGARLYVNESVPYVQRDGPPVIIVPAKVTTSSEGVRAQLDAIADELGHALDADGNGVEDVLDVALDELSPGTVVDIILVFPSLANKTAGLAQLAALADVDLSVQTQHLPVQIARVPLALVASAAALSGAVAYHDGTVTVSQTAAPSPLRSQDAIRAPEARGFGLDGTGVAIAILDTGIDATHQSLDDLDDRVDTFDPKVVAWRDFVGVRTTPYDDHGHGTHVAGTAAGTMGEVPMSFDPTGVAPGATLVVAKVLGGSGGGAESGIIKAIDWVLALRSGEMPELGVISMSLGRNVASNGRAPLEIAVDEAVAQGVVVVVAAGNSGPGSRTVGVPASAREAITVGAVDDAGRLASFSSRGPTADGRHKPEVSAPGLSVLSAVPGAPTRYARMSGTSMATPHVAGAAALILHASAGTADPREVRELLIQSGPNADAWENNKDGAGLIDVVLAAGNVRMVEHDLSIAAIRLPDYRARSPPHAVPGEVERVEVIVNNGGVHDEHNVIVRFNEESRTLPLVPAKTRQTVTFHWTPAVASIYLLNARVEPTAAELAAPADERRLVNNELQRIVFATTYGFVREHPWINLTARFEPARSVVSISHETIIEPQPDKSRDMVSTNTKLLLLDGFRGQGEARRIQTVSYVHFAAHGGPTDVAAGYELDKLEMWSFYATGGSPAGIEVGDRRVAFIPPGQCWNFPLARYALVHATCWGGGTMPTLIVHNVGAGASPGACANAAMAATRYASAAGTTGAIGALVGLRTTAERALDPVLWGTKGGVDAQSTIGSSASSAAQLAMGTAGALATLALGCASAVSVARPTAFAFPPGAPVPDVALTDLATTHPLIPKDSPIPLDLPSSPSPPVSLRAFRGPLLGQIRLTWEPPAFDRGAHVHGYDVHRKDPDGTFAIVGSTDGVTSYVDMGLADGTLYEYVVSARSILGDGEMSEPAFATTYVRRGPDVPTNLSVMPGPGLGELTVNWTFKVNASLPPTQHWSVEIVAPDGTHQRVLLADPRTMSARVTGLAHDAWHDLAVRGINEAGEGEPSTPAGERTYKATPPGPVRDLAARAGPEYGAVNVSWTAPIDDGGMPPTGYRVYRKTDGDEIFLQQASGVARWFHDGRPPRSPLPNGSEHTYRVYAVNAVGAGESATTAGRTYGVPPAPTALSADPTRVADAVSLSWTAPDPAHERVESYSIFVSVNGSAETRLATLNGTSYDHHGTTPDTTYVYRVHATNKVGEGPFSEPLTIVMGGRPSVPRDVVATPGSVPGALALSWSPPEETSGRPVLSYRVYVLDAATGPRLLANPSGTSASLAGLGLNMTRYGVSAVTDYGEGAIASVMARPYATYTARGHAATATVAGLTYMLGGVANGVASDQVAIYDPATNATRLDLRAGIPNGSAYGAAATDGRYVYVFGGHIENTMGAPTDRILRYDPQTGAVETLAARLGSGRASAMAAYANGTIWIFGGESGGVAKGDLEAFDPQTGTLQRVGSMPANSDRYGAGVAEREGHVYLFGGRRDAEILKTVLLFDARNVSFSAVNGQLPNATYHPAIAVNGSYAYVMGGCATTDCSTRVATVARFALNGASPSVAVGLAAPFVSTRGPAASWRDGPVSHSGCAKTCSPAVSTVSVYATQPGAIPAVQTIPSGTGERTVTWTPPKDEDHIRPITGYRIHRAVSPTGPWTVVAELPASELSFTDAGLSGNSYHRVSAIDGPFIAGPLTGSGGGSPGIVGAGRPGEPTALVATNGSGNVTLAWSAPVRAGTSPILDYVVYRIGDDSVRTEIGRVTSRTATVPAEASPFRVLVVARSSVGEGPFSAIVWVHG